MTRNGDCWPSDVSGSAERSSHAAPSAHARGKSQGGDKEDPKSLCGILGKLGELARCEYRVSVGDVVETLGHRSYGPFLLVPALIEISPLGGIPGVPTALAAIIVLFAVQMLAGREHLWLPAFVRKRSIDCEKMQRAVEKLQPLARKVDRWFHGRLPRLTRGPFPRFAAAGSIALACTVPPFELLPFASSIPMAAIAAFGLALIVRDGLLMLLALLLSAATLAAGVAFLVTGRGS